MPSIRDLYDAYVVYCQSGELYQCEYSIVGDEVTLGDATEVQVSYVPVVSGDSSSGNSGYSNSTESSEPIKVRGDIIELVEKAVRSDGTARVKLISPGWGSSGYYSKEMLQRDGAKVFPKGTHMYMNHPTEQENLDRPERDIRDLAGVQETDAAWEDAASTNTGDGLYANVKVFPTYRQFIDEASSAIGVSIRASGTAMEGEAESRHGMIVDSLLEGYSVDYVTMAGRGGEVLPLYESARKRITADPENTVITIHEYQNPGIVSSIMDQNSSRETLLKIDTTNLGEIKVDITQEELTSLREAAANSKKQEETLTTVTAQLAESNKNLARMQEAMILSEARSIVEGTLAGLNIPDMVKARLLAECAKNPPVKEGTLDKEALVEATKATVVEEMKYIQSITGVTTGGRVVGVGASDPVELTEADVDKDLETAFASYGLSEKGLRTAVNGRMS
jgi:hypothetical protein